MVQEASTLKTTLSKDFDELAAELASLRAEIGKLVQSAAAGTEQRGRRMASDVAEGFGEAMHYVERKGKNGEAELERTIAAHPLLALGLAAGAGLLIGALTRR